jgi:hypothetical protein
MAAFRAGQLINEIHCTLKQAWLLGDRRLFEVGDRRVQELLTVIRQTVPGISQKDRLTEVIENEWARLHGYTFTADYADEYAAAWEDLMAGLTAQSAPDSTIDQWGRTSLQVRLFVDGAVRAIEKELTEMQLRVLRLGMLIDQVRHPMDVHRIMVQPIRKPRRRKQSRTNTPHECRSVRTAGQEHASRCRKLPFEIWPLGSVVYHFPPSWYHHIFRRCMEIGLPNEVLLAMAPSRARPSIRQSQAAVRKVEAIVTAALSVGSPNENGIATGSTMTAAFTPATFGKKRGRPSTIDRDYKLWERWLSREFKSKAAMARKLNMQSAQLCKALARGREAHAANS